MSEEDKENLFRRGSEIPVSSAEAKQALDKLRIVPDLEFYAVAPAFDKATGVRYAYASQPMIDEFYGNDPEVSMDIEDVEYFYDRWTSTLIFESNEILLTNGMLENSSCDNNTIGDYYKLGPWDGRMSNGRKAPLGAYVFEINYKEKKDSEITKLFGSITLIR